MGKSQVRVSWALESRNEEEALLGECALTRM